MNNYGNLIPPELYLLQVALVCGLIVAVLFGWLIGFAAFLISPFVLIALLVFIAWVDEKLKKKEEVGEE